MRKVKISVFHSPDACFLSFIYTYIHICSGLRVLSLLAQWPEFKSQIPILNFFKLGIDVHLHWQLDLKRSLETGVAETSSFNSVRNLASRQQGEETKDTRHICSSLYMHTEGCGHPYIHGYIAYKYSASAHKHTPTILWHPTFLKW